MNSKVNEEKGKLKFTRRQKELVKKVLFSTILVIICAGCIYWIYQPSGDDKKQQGTQNGFNTDIPMPNDEGIILDKRDAYMKEQMKQKQAERMRSLEDFSAMLGDKAPAEQRDEISLVADNATPSNKQADASSRPPSGIENSTMAYQDVNRALDNFYGKPKKSESNEDLEKEWLRQELTDLKTRMNETDNRKNEVDKQLDLMEKSFQMAAKYIPGTTSAGTALAAQVTEATENAKTAGNNASGKLSAMPVTQVEQQTVSCLKAEMSGAEFANVYSQPRNTFMTVTAEDIKPRRNTILACIQNSQTVMDGQTVRLRSLEPMRVSNAFIPQGTEFSGKARIMGERLEITVNLIEYSRTIIPVELNVYDTDGLKGIFIPNMQELNAAKEVLASMGTTAGTSINLSNDAGEQFVADMGRNAIQGISQFFSKKMREVKVNLKAGYQVFLIPEGGLKVNLPQLASIK